MWAALVTFSEASVVREWLLGPMTLRGPFQLPSLWLCDHIRPLCLGSLTAAERSPARRGSRGSPSPTPRPRGPRQQRGAQVREARGPSSVASSQRAPALSGGLVPLSLSPHPHLRSPHCAARFPESSWRHRPKAGHSGPQSQPLLATRISSGLVAWNPSQSP